MKTLLFNLLSVLLHALFFGFFSVTHPEPDLTFRKGEIAMELLEPKSTKAKTKPNANNTEGILEKEGKIEMEPVNSGIQSGSSLGIVAPEYPDSSRIKGEEGEVIVSYELDNTKKLISFKIEKSSGFESLDKSALKAIESHYDSSKARSNSTKYRVRFNFQLTK